MAAEHLFLVEHLAMEGLEDLEDLEDLEEEL